MGVGITETIVPCVQLCVFPHALLRLTTSVNVQGINTTTVIKEAAPTVDDVWNVAGMAVRECLL